MAKGSLNGVMTGKKGNTVFYRIKNSSNKEKQGSREYTPTISNPKTMAQAVQRLKLAPANAFYRAFQGLLNHSWQGVQYGGRSHSKFMSEVLRTDFLFPFLLKGDASFVPGQYPMSRGSLPSIVVTGIADNDGTPLAEISLSLSVFGDGTVASDTFTSFVEQTVSVSGGLLSFGDQITVAFVRRFGDDFVPSYREVILDPSKYATDTVQSVFAETGLSLDNASVYVNDFATLGSIYEYVGDIVAAAVIVSRPQVSNTSTTAVWLRSSADMFVVPEVLAQYSSQALYDAAIASYMGLTATVDSPWYLNQGTTRGGGDTDFPDIPNATITVTNVSRTGAQLFTGLPEASQSQQRDVMHLVSVPLGINAYVLGITQPAEGSAGYADSYSADSRTSSAGPVGEVVRNVTLTGPTTGTIGFATGVNAVSYDTAVQLLNRYGGNFDGTIFTRWD